MLGNHTQACGTAIHNVKLSIGGERFFYFTISIIISTRIQLKTPYHEYRAPALLRLGYCKLYRRTADDSEGFSIVMKAPTCCLSYRLI